MPPWLLAGALLFWGWNTGIWWLAAPLAILAELPRIKHWQWELELKERQRVADLCSVLIVLTGAYLYLNQPRLGVALILLIQWLPALVFPLLAVQLYGRHGGLELSVLFLSLRGDKPHGHDTLDLRWAYLLLCVIAASMIPPETVWYYPSLVLLALWALFSSPLPGQAAGAGPTRATAGRRHWLQRLGALALAALIGIGLSTALRWGHDEVERLVMGWIDDRLGTNLDPYRASTAIGEVGTLKGSDRIRLRIYPQGTFDGELLRTASYDRYIDGTWFTSGSPFEALPTRDGRGIIQASNTPTRELRILMQLQRPEGLLPLPSDAVAVAGLDLTQLHRNGFGTVRFRAAGGESLFGYRVQQPIAADPVTQSEPEPSLAPPDAVDLRVVGPVAEMLTQVAAELKLTQVSPAEAVRRLQRHFNTHFRYTLNLPRIPPDQRPLSHFLLQGRAGHCEYFATAAAMLLRKAGIPARYARGWSVQEYSPLEDAWISRDSHAHAWVLVWIDGAWRNFDPTPPDWGALEAADRPWTIVIGDWVSWLRLSLSGAGDEDHASRNWLLLPLTVLILILAWRIARRARRGARHQQLATRTDNSDSGVFTAIELAAGRQGLPRRSGETLWDWAQRIAPRFSTGRELREAVCLHYRNRFDPNGLDAGSRTRLAALLAVCLKGRR
ncbi:MAG: transglutaminase domain-containing protein [Thiohalocapsa sp.]